MPHRPLYKPFVYQ
ncbi:hypothetical protein CGLO_12451 [Colletotrichum gloeosporioides Cg-14]|uniref:Uncharacterized protein n=1 Tax=Colletotrichum gloeosporioides (strain Cg-14) TaxID=1237896 RepID=T0LJG4_COLGC|nr:hypothetical protein CGLO_12451 [Colletotrichum gloeosporioides Cg-14]